MQKEKGLAAQRAILVLLVVNLLAVTGVILYLVFSSATTASLLEGEEQGIEYTLYIGTNDKDTYTQLISLEDARETVNGICAKYVDGYTVQQANGSWVDETGTLTQEETLVYKFVDVDEETLTAIMDEVLAELNQNSILVERSALCYRYYNGQ